MRRPLQVWNAVAAEPRFFFRGRARAAAAQKSGRRGANNPHYATLMGGFERFSGLIWWVLGGVLVSDNSVRLVGATFQAAYQGGGAAPCPDNFEADQETVTYPYVWRVKTRLPGGNYLRKAKGAE